MLQAVIFVRNQKQGYPSLSLPPHLSLSPPLCPTPVLRPPSSSPKKPRYLSCFQSWVGSRENPEGFWKVSGAGAEAHARIAGQALPLWFECVIVWIHLACNTIVSSLVDTDFKALWKGGMLSIMGTIIMGFRWKKLRFRPSLRPGSMTEQGEEKSKRLYSSQEKEAACSHHPHIFSPKVEGVARSTTKLWNSQGELPQTPNNLLMLLPHQTSGSQTGWLCSSGDIWEFRETYWLSRRRERVYNQHPMGQGWGWGCWPAYRAQTDPRAKTCPAPNVSSSKRETPP